MRHLVAEIRFPPKSEIGVVWCTCGQEMPTDLFQEHRKAQGMKTGILKGTGEPNVWRLHNVGAAR